MTNGKTFHVPYNILIRVHIHRKNIPALWRPYFSLDQYDLQRVTQGLFVPNYFQIDPVAFDKIKNWSCPLATILSTDQYDLSNLDRGSLKDHLLNHFQISTAVFHTKTKAAWNWNL